MLPLLLHCAFAFLAPSNSQRISRIRDFVAIDVVNVSVKHLAISWFTAKAMVCPITNTHYNIVVVVVVVVVVAVDL